MNKTVIALAWGALGTFLFTLYYASHKLTGGEVSVFQILLLRYATGFSCLLLIARLQKRALLSYKSKRPRHHFYRSIVGLGGEFCIIYATFLSPIADVTALGLMDGLLTVLLSVWFLGEVVRIKQWFGAGLCVLGAVVILFGSNNGILLEGFGSGLWFALLGAILIAIESVLIKILTFSDQSMTILLHVNFISMLICLLPMLYFWTTPNLLQLAFFISLGPIVVLAQFCWVKAYKLERVAVVTPINYCWIIFAAVLGYLFFDETLSLSILLGAGLIVVGGFFLTRSSVSPCKE